MKLNIGEDVDEPRIDMSPNPWFFPLAIYIHLGIVGLMKDSTPFVVYVIN